MLSEELIKRERHSGCEGVTWVRSPYQKPPRDGVIYGGVEKFANRHGLNNDASLKGDSGMIGSWNLLSCNHSFFQNTKYEIRNTKYEIRNTNVASDESTADFYLAAWKYHHQTWRHGLMMCP